MNSDIVIIGAGPAGCATSIFLSKEKVPHIIIDKSRFPRDKICGDALSGKSVSVLQKIDPIFAKQLINNKTSCLPSWGCSFIAPNGMRIDIPFKKQIENTEPPGFLSKRMDFDNSLFNQLNPNYATIIQNAHVHNLTKKENGFIVDYTQDNTEQQIHAKLIIGADGAQGITSKKTISIKKDPTNFSAGLRAYYSNVTGFHPNNFIELHFLPEVLPGYLWIFPLANNQANVGVGMLNKYVSEKKINLKTALLNAVANNPHIKDRFANATMISPLQGWGLPLGRKKNPLSGDHFILTGDAGSLIDPFTGEGIGNALYSGMIAAQYAQLAVKEQNFTATFLKQYETHFYKHQWDELKLSSMLLKLSKYAWLMNFVIKKAAKNQPLQEAITCMFEDLNMRAKLTNPLFYFKILFNK